MQSFSLGYIHNGAVRAEFCASLVEAVRMPQCRRALSACGLYLHSNRNLVVKEFLLKSDAEWLLFVDTDIGFAPEHIEILLTSGSAERRIVAGLYFVHSRLFGGHISVLTEMWKRRAGDDPAPWFGHDHVPTLAGVLEAPEDVTFCMRAKEAGFATYGVPAVAVDHYKTIAVTPAVYEKLAVL
ncbi:MAG: hypothetical protein DMD33_00915 [Gemmatimonadetes bacterium]|nr:MAG: hypothetical protein DMD33_00915 [Gemmatimonadota bacterium]